MFAERLNFIMELTGTRASALGKASMVDASHISRLRWGNRALPKKPTFLPAMSTYLARRVTTDYQRQSLCDIMSLPTAWPSDEEKAASLIGRWLIGEDENLVPVEPILKSFTGTHYKKPAMDEETNPTRLTSSRRFYFGPEGKREAVLHFFALILREKSPQTLLLFSNEEMSWLYEDEDFAARWKADFIRVLKAGNRVKIIHTVSRNIHEMLEAVNKWVPLYMTGTIEPYYYPKLRDGVFQGTRFIAPETAAVISSSVTQKTDGMLNELIEDPEAVSALAKEYENYLSLCRPLMRILNSRNSDEYWTMRRALELAEGDSICLSGLPVLATMPDSVADALQARAPDSCIRFRRDESAASLFRHLEERYYTELIPELIPEKIKNGLPLPCADLLGAPDLRYTPEEYRAHRENMLALSAKYKNYRVLSTGEVPLNLMLYGKENRGILMTKTDVPGVTFAFSEPNMTAAFWDYLFGNIRISDH
ncbi:MAG: hypothetical protein AB7D36_03960 [Oscillospiraceae bacterium]